MFGLTTMVKIKKMDFFCRLPLTKHMSGEVLLRGWNKISSSFLVTNLLFLWNIKFIPNRVIPFHPLTRINRNQNKLLQDLGYKMQDARKN